MERDQAVRRLMTAALQGAGFGTYPVPTLDAATLLVHRHSASVVVCEWTPLTAHLSRAMLDRTVIATALPRVAASVHPFATVQKPIDVRELVGVVRACAEPRPQRTSRQVLNDALEHFVENLRAFKRVLEAPAVDDRERLIRGEMRRTMQELSAAFAEAAQAESCHRTASHYTAAAVRAARSQV